MGVVSHGSARLVIGRAKSVLFMFYGTSLTGLVKNIDLNVKCTAAWILPSSSCLKGN